MDNGAKFVVDNFKKVLDLVNSDEKYKEYASSVSFEYAIIKSLKKTGDAYDYFLKYADKSHKNSEKFEFLKDYNLLPNEEMAEYLLKNYPDEINNHISIDDFVVNEVYTNSDLYIVFTEIMRGIRYNEDKNIIAAISTPDSVYGDRWVEDNLLYYTGEGKEGDQNPENNRNKLLLTNKGENKIYLFEKPGTDKYYYRGEVYIDGSIKTEKRIDEKGNERTVIVYPLRVKDPNFKITIDESDQKVIDLNNEKEIEDLTEEKVKELAKRNSGRRVVKKVVYEQYDRDPAISKYAKLRANGKCDLCGMDAPFITKKGPFLESHHLITLAEGGPDAIYNTVALCPNCHRRMHHLKDKEDFIKLSKLIEKYLLDDKDLESIKKWEELFK